MKKSNIRFQFALILFISVAMFLLAGCSGSVEKDVAGKWTETGKPGYAEFSADKSLKINDGKSDYTGTWSIANKNQLNLQFTAMGKQQNVTWDKVTIKGDTMTFTLGAMEYKFNRIK